MTLDIFAAILLAALAVLVPALAVLGSPLDTRQQRLAIAIASAWLALLVALAGLGLFSRIAGTPAVGAAAVLPVILLMILRGRSTLLGTLAAGLPLALMVALNAGRVLGALFLLLHAAGRLPPTFAFSAGWGDIIAGLTALPLALAVSRQVPGWRAGLLLWNLFGTLDLLTAVFLGGGSAAGSPFRFVFEHPGSEMMGDLPWILIPGYLVPFYLSLHVLVFSRLWALRHHGKAHQSGAVTR